MSHTYTSNLEKSDHDGQTIRYGMVGGGPGAFIGAIHRMAARLEGRYELLAGAFSSDRERGRAAGSELGVAPQRTYLGYEEMAQSEASRPDGIEAVVIVTPNHLHYPVARAFLEAGVHIICDKPLTTTVSDALALRDLVKSTGKLFSSPTLMAPIRWCRRHGRWSVADSSAPCAWSRWNMRRVGCQRRLRHKDRRRPAGGQTRRLPDRAAVSGILVRTRIIWLNT